MKVETSFSANASWDFPSLRSEAPTPSVLKSTGSLVIPEWSPCMCLALRASGLWLRYATLQNLIPSFPWIAPPRSPPWRNPRKGRDQILPSGNLGSTDFRRSAVEYSDFEEAVGAFNPLFHAFSVELPAIRVGEYCKERSRNKEYKRVCSSTAVFLHTLQKTSLKVILCNIYLLGKHRPSPSFTV